MQSTGVIYVDLTKVAKEGSQWQAAADCTDAASWLKYQVPTKAASLALFVI